MVSIGPRRILIVDRHALARLGFVALIDRVDDLSVCGEAVDSASALEQVERERPDMVLLDPELRRDSGFDLIRMLRERFPDLPVLVCSMQDELVYSHRYLSAGASGYLGKHEPACRILDVVRRVLGGEMHISSRAAARIIDRNRGEESRERDFLDNLTDRELEVLHFLADGLGTREIAGALDISTKTVQTYRMRIMQKLEIRNAPELIRYAIQLNQRDVG